MAMAVASKYARALADLVVDPAHGLDPQTAVDELAALERMVSGSAELRNILLSPAVPPPRKRAVVARLAGELNVSRLVRNFLYVIIDHRRTAMLGEIRQAFQALIDERTGWVEAEITVARELGGGDRETVALRLGRLTGKKVRCKFVMNDGLIGGMVARIGSTIYDGSVRGQLETLRLRLTE